MITLFRRLLVYLGLRVDANEDPVREAREMRESLSESQIDETVKESFPSSDPPSTY